MNVIGQIKSIRGLVCEVRLTGERPAPKELLLLESNPSVVLEVATYPNPYTARCINLAGSSEVRRGANVVLARSTITIPENRAVLGRVLNAFAEPIDGGEPIAAIKRRSIYDFRPFSNVTNTQPELLETGIKAIDFFTPFVK